MSNDVQPKPTWTNLKGHLKTITRHKLTVMNLCFRVGLYSQGLRHDLSKYTPVELITGARYYQGYRSPNAAERESRGFSGAWLHHKGRNRHHFEYWIDIIPEGDGSWYAAGPMPMRYIVEMFCDRVAASKIYQGDAYTDESALVYFEQNKDHLTMHPDTMAALEGMLEYLAEHGEDATLAAIKTEIVQPRWCFGEAARF